MLLAPHIDRLFDKGWISFTDTGDLLVTESAAPILEAWGIVPSLNVGKFTAKQQEYLHYHRTNILKQPA